MSATHLCWQEELTLERMWCNLPKQTHRNLMSVPLPWLWGSTHSSLKFLWYWNLAWRSLLGLFFQTDDPFLQKWRHAPLLLWLSLMFILKKQTSASFSLVLMCVFWLFFSCKWIWTHRNTAKVLWPWVLVIELSNLILLIHLVMNSSNLVIFGFLHLSFSCKQETQFP